MKVEIHSHTDKYSPCSKIPPHELVQMAEASGYDALFITDHNRVWPDRDLRGLKELCTRMRIFPAIEISLPNRHDMLVLGAENPVYESMTRAEEVLAQACADGYLTVLAHPFRYHSELPQYSTLADALEVRTCNHSDPAHLEAASAYAREHNVAEVYASDAHGLNFMNKFWIETEAPFATPQEFRRLIVSGQYKNRTRNFDMPLPPPYRVATMAELTEDDLMSLCVEPAALK